MASNRAVEQLTRQSDLIMALGVVGVIGMMVVPLPPALIDVLLTLNMAFALCILLVSMYVGEPLEFSAFPAILLTATLFRLALNISTTRLILLRGEAGKVIGAFGQFVVGGEYLVGFVIFLILVIVQFVVITNGSQRIAEVTARFTLDEMPGKQLSIDADLNAGIIDDNEAKQRRREIEREADFYGAMDGASKFVRGDAIAGVIIIIVNLLGGVATGVFRLDLPAGEALKKFALLTVGDGLVSQVPALLISTATGLVVTRAASESNLGTDVANQMLRQSRPLLIAGFVLVLLSVVPGVPTLSFIIVGLLFVALWAASRKQAPPSEAHAEPPAAKAPQPPETFADLLESDAVALELGYGLVPLADPKSGGTLLDRVTGVRRQAALTLGTIVPPVRVRDAGTLGTNEYAIKLRDSIVARGELRPDRYLAIGPEADGANVPGEHCTEPVFHAAASWLTAAERPVAEALGLTVVDCETVLATHLSETIRRHAAEILTREDVQQMINAVRESAPTIVSELIPDRATVGDVQQVLRALLRENVPVRNLPAILEAMADALKVTDRIPHVVELVRQSIGRQICDRLEADDGLHVLALEPTVERTLADAIVEGSQGPVCVPDASFLERLIQAIDQAAERVAALGRDPVVLTSAQVRPHVRSLIAPSLPHLPVVSHAEVVPEVRIASLETIALAEAA
ncbi:MAG: flagellar biosynthesis protein FlhA [Armatimonadota bacterium]